MTAPHEQPWICRICDAAMLGPPPEDPLCGRCVFLLDQLEAHEAGQAADIDLAEGHPESLTVELPDAEEIYLAELASQLWPDDEYLLIDRGGR